MIEQKICPVNERPCRCDELSCELMKRVSKIFRKLSSNFDHEKLTTLSMLEKLGVTENISLNDIGAIIEGWRWKIGESCFSEAEVKTIYEKGLERGRAERQDSKLEFVDIDGQPRWYDIALFIRDNVGQLSPGWETDFANDIPSKVFNRSPSPKQAKWILKLFIQLGGRCEPAVLQAAYLRAQ
jgi:hypothetical protein